MAKRILLVDDEPLIVKGLKFALESDGYETDSAGDGEQALEKIQNGNFDLILLDVMLPKMSGIEVCQAVREKSDVPIIMLTAKGEDMDKILGLEYGADDYMTKPFNILEVKAQNKDHTPQGGRRQGGSQDGDHRRGHHNKHKYPQRYKPWGACEPYGKGIRPAEPVHVQHRQDLQPGRAA